MKLDRSFYRCDSITLAKKLLGKKLVHEIEGERISGIIVECEAYMGVIDKAAHVYGGRRTERVKVMYGECGYAYVYFIYGLYYCFNVVAAEVETPQAVLVRALEPLEGLEIMSRNRFNKDYDELTKTQIKNLTNGPAKLCNSLKINRELNGEDLCGEKLYIEDSNIDNFEIVDCKRIGIDYAEEAKDYLYRFYIKDNKFVSKF
ncbi:DNA-3-methyladenine glycosylase [Clostridium sp. UBA6640]|uniref:DNA-3-methyladenine glycosylase n=1 Tax=Clostridium sp. UBA6640 TaxID=1946370 RepID=UPI0025BF928E|nr:DNA-3-methyladenine glycosylase [Clostridium sp. UBA6640]